MKNKCNVAKDLMPLVIDGVASEESKQYVDEHIAECTECALTYGAMRVELPRISAEKEKAAMELAAKKMRNKRILRGVMGGVLAILLFIIGSWTVENLNYRLTQYCSETVSLDRYSASVMHLPNGIGVVMLKMNEADNLCTAPRIHYVRTMQDGEVKTVLEIELMTTIIPQYRDGDSALNIKIDRTLFLGNITEEGWMIPQYDWEGTDGPLDEIVLISNDTGRRVIYQHGDNVSLASKELETYYETQHSSRPSDYSHEEWMNKLIQVKYAVPEWQ